jgi:hypothetical protein
MKESANDCILASGEGHGSRGETFQPIYVASPVSSSVEHPVKGYKKRLRSYNYKGYFSVVFKAAADVDAMYCVDDCGRESNNAVFNSNRFGLWINHKFKQPKTTLYTT